MNDERTAEELDILRAKYWASAQDLATSILWLAEDGTLQLPQGTSSHEALTNFAAARLAYLYPDRFQEVER